MTKSSATQEERLEIHRLKQALDVKNSAIQKEVWKSNDLSAKLRDDDRLILCLIEFLYRMKEGDVEK